MPVDMTIPNSILGAYFQGLEQKRRTKLTELQAEKQAEEKAQFEKTLQQHQKQWDEAHKLNLARYDLDAKTKAFDAKTKLMGMMATGAAKPVTGGITEIPGMVMPEEYAQQATNPNIVGTPYGNIEITDPFQRKQALDALDISKAVDVYNKTTGKTQEKALESRENLATDAMLSRESIAKMNLSSAEKRAEEALKAQMQMNRERIGGQLEAARIRTAASLGKMGAKIPTSAQNKITDYNMILSLADQANNLWQKSDAVKKSVGALGTGSVKKFIGDVKNVISGKEEDPDVIAFRGMVGQLTAMISHPLFGANLTHGEKAILNKFSASINQRPQEIPIHLKQILNEFSKGRENVYKMNGIPSRLVVEED